MIVDDKIMDALTAQAKASSRLTQIGHQEKAYLSLPVNPNDWFGLNCSF